MGNPTETTTQLRALLEGMATGDRVAEKEFLRVVTGSLERLTRKRLKRFPGIQRWVEAEDVLQNVFLRMLPTLKRVKPLTMRDFLGLAAGQIRRE